MQTSDKGRHGKSYERKGLSVSLYPEVWEEIAELDGLPWWKSTKNDAIFLSALELSPEQRETIYTWEKE